MMVLTKSFIIPNKLGLHARAAAQLVKAANRFLSEITLSTKKQAVNAKSIMGVLMLAASQGTKISVKVEGKDAADALEAIEALIQNKFGEE
jgi:phosphocarrier protein HPr